MLEFVISQRYNIAVVHLQRHRNSFLNILFLLCQNVHNANAKCRFVFYFEYFLMQYAFLKIMTVWQVDGDAEPLSPNPPSSGSVRR